MWMIRESSRPARRAQTGPGVITKKSRPPSGRPGKAPAQDVDRVSLFQCRPPTDLVRLRASANASAAGADSREGARLLPASRPSRRRLAEQRRPSARGSRAAGSHLPRYNYYALQNEITAASRVESPRRPSAPAPASRGNALVIDRCTERFLYYRSIGSLMPRRLAFENYIARVRRNALQRHLLYDYDLKKYFPGMPFKRLKNVFFPISFAIIIAAYFVSVCGVRGRLLTGDGFRESRSSAADDSGNVEATPRSGTSQRLTESGQLWESALADNNPYYRNI
ncbi:hypothetical protein EVAR_15675_1 [Eumeta japonica]|uniref:Uncharacterized protein n=1 Tax=Eumeta variegata TaxID=151549 RepID=A0A4C1U9G4_EUMVA|nr:hypothetical protein EVAR_15675_1 [Eumeta japonica]